jgi:hypothetical protein
MQSPKELWVRSAKATDLDALTLIRLAAFLLEPQWSYRYFMPLNSPRVILNSLLYAIVNGFKKQVSLTALQWSSKEHHLRRDTDPFHMAAYYMSVIFAQERYFDRLYRRNGWDWHGIPQYF